LAAYEERVLKPLIAQACLGIHEDDITPDCWLQLRLIVGIPFVTDFASSAYLAASKRAILELETVKGRGGHSVADRLRELDASEYVPDLLPHEQAYRSALQDFKSRARNDIFQRDGAPPFPCTGATLLGDDFFAGKCAKGYLPKAAGGRSSTAQRQAFLTSYVVQRKFEDLAARLSPEDAKRLMSSLEGGNAFCKNIPWGGKGRTAFERERYELRHTVSTGQRFRIAVMMHAGIPLGKGTSSHSSVNARINTHHAGGCLWGTADLICNVCNVAVDAHGLHFACTCGGEGAKSAVHNAVAKVLFDVALEARMKVRREVATGLGNNGQPHFKDADVWHKDGPGGRPYAVDVKTFSTTSGATCLGKTGLDIITSDGGPSVRWKYADDKEHGANLAAVARNNANNHDFKPFISDCFGGLHATAREHLAWLSTVNARAGFWQGKQHKLYRAYCKRLSVATADALAAIVEQRVSTVINRASSGVAGDEDFPVIHFRLLTSERARAHILREDANAGWPDGPPRGQ
jgi:hypothetical protein